MSAEEIAGTALALILLGVVWRSAMAMFGEAARVSASEKPHKWSPQREEFERVTRAAKRRRPTKRRRKKKR